MTLLAPYESPGLGRVRLVTVERTLSTTPGLANLLAKEKASSIIESTLSGGDTMAVCLRLAPCILIVDDSFVEKIQPSALVSAQQAPAWVRVLVVIDNDDLPTHLRLLKLGYVGAVNRAAARKVFRRALQAVSEGELWAGRKTLSILIRELQTQKQPAQLTIREREVFALVAAGCTNQDIADRLCISKETVRWHVRAVYGKMGVGDRRSAVKLAVSSGLLVPKPATAEISAEAQTRAKRAGLGS